MKLKPKNVDEDVVTSGRRISENSSPKIFKKSFSTQICRKVIFWLFFCFPFLVDAEPFYSVKQPFREMASGMGHSVRGKSAWRRAWATGCVIKLLNSESKTSILFNPHHAYPHWWSIKVSDSDRFQGAEFRNTKIFVLALAKERDDMEQLYGFQIKSRLHEQSVKASNSQ